MGLRGSEREGARAGGGGGVIGWDSLSVGDDLPAQAQFRVHSNVVASVFPAAAAPPGSILTVASIFDKEKDPVNPVVSGTAGRAAKGGGSTVRRESIDSVMRASGVSKDQPVTFKTKIKSSGYTTAPSASLLTRSSSSCKKPPKSSGKLPLAAANGAGVGVGAGGCEQGEQGGGVRWGEVGWGWGEGEALRSQ